MYDSLDGQVKSVVFKYVRVDSGRSDVFPDLDMRDLPYDFGLDYYFRYDSAGNLVYESGERIAGGPFITERTFNSKRQPLLELDYHDRPKRLHYKYLYDYQNGLLKKKQGFSYDFHKTECRYFKSEFYYTDKDYEAESINYGYDCGDTSVKRITRNKNDYDSMGNLIKRMEYNLETLHKIITCQYNEDKSTCDIREYYPPYNSGYLQHKTFDKAGRLLIQRVLDMDSTFSWERIFEYDAAGKYVKRTLRSKLKDETVIYIRNRDGYVTEEKHYHGETFEYSKTMTLDKHGNPVQYLYTDKNGKTIWRSFLKIEYY